MKLIYDLFMTYYKERRDEKNYVFGDGIAYIGESLISIYLRLKRERISQNTESRMDKMVKGVDDNENISKYI
ncbi:MAG: hypothetical protein ABIJ34_06030 [archaeon]